MFSWARNLVGLLVCALAVAAVSCGGGGGSTPPPGGGSAASGSASIFITDQPADDVVKIELTVTGVVFNPGNVPVLSQPQELEVTQLQLTQELLRLASNIPAGSYSSIVFTFAPTAEVKFFNSGTGSIQEVDVPVSPATETVNVSFTIAAGQTTALLVDFDVPGSLIVNAGGIIISIDPMLTATVVTPLPDEFEDEVGRVVSVNSSANTFVFEPFDTCQQVTVTVNANTEFEDFDEAVPPLANSFSSLMANQIVEVDADVQANGTLLAEEVELEDDEMEDEAEGLIVDVTRNASDEVTQFVMVPLDVAPCTASLGSLDTITVLVPPSGVEFRIDEDGLPVSNNLFDDPTDLDIGQNVDVDPTTSLGSTITAEEIKLDDQTIRGEVISVAPPNFLFDPASDLFPDQDIEVVTFTGITEFDNPPGSVSGLAGGDDVRVRGLLFRLGPDQHQLAAKRVRED